MIQFGVKWRDQRPVSVSIRKWNEYGRKAHQAMAEHWYGVLLPRHFQPDAKEKYKHQQRTEKYLARKRKAAARGTIPAHHANTDNVYKGRMRRMLLKGSKSVKIFPSRFTVTVTGPRYISMKVLRGDRKALAAKGATYGKGRKKKKISATAGKQPDKRAEILRDTDQERSELFRIGEKTLFDLMNSEPAVETRSIG